MKIALTGFWLMLSSACVVLPVFVPSNVFSSEPFANVVGTSAVTMFILSFPASLLGLPISMLLQSAFALGQYSLMGLYVNTLVFFALGLCQWFWAVPTLQAFTAEARAAREESSETRVGEISGMAMPAFDDDELSPVERVFDEGK
ncbi:MAG TPA: hypothetical protein VL572_04840 [Pyrinomonadaceae bacterium]|nr:hypothetical protein [Pyrinomonadaceae bacterium]